MVPTVLQPPTQAHPGVESVSNRVSNLFFTGGRHDSCKTSKIYVGTRTVCGRWSGCSFSRVAPHSGHIAHPTLFTFCLWLLLLILLVFFFLLLLVGHSAERTRWAPRVWFEAPALTLPILDSFLTADRAARCGRAASSLEASIFKTAREKKPGFVPLTRSS